MNSSQRTRSLQRFSTVLLVLLIPATLTWLVNLELAIQILYPGWSVLQAILPSFIFDPLAHLGSDLSTISTLVPLLLLAFPFVMARKILRFTDSVDDKLRHLIYDPYPPHFPFFLVMLGLAGTLYGLLIGLDVSGVEKLGSDMASPESIQATLDRLLAGTATALLSSLLGLAGAFLAARPFTWLFHRVVGMPQEEESAGITEALQHLIQDLQTLGEASRSFGQQLSHTDLEAIPTTLRAIHDELRVVGSGLTDTNQKIQTLGDVQAAGQAQLAPLEHLGQLDRLTALESILSELRTAQEQSNSGQNDLINVIRQSLEQQGEAARKTAEDLAGLRQDLKAMDTLLRDVEGHGRQAQTHLGEMVQTLEHVLSHTETAGRQAKEDASRMIDILERDQRLKQADRSSLHKAAGIFLDRALTPTDQTDDEA